MSKSRSITVLAAVIALLAPSLLTAQSRIEWLFEPEQAVRAATERNVPILVSVRIAGARGMAALEDELDSDRRIGELTARTVNLMVPLASASDTPGEAEEWLRKLLEVTNKDATPRAPNHILLRVGSDGGDDSGQESAPPAAAGGDGPGGAGGTGTGVEILSAASGALTAGQLEWLLADGIRRFDDTFEWTPDDRTRAPLTFRLGEADGAGLPTPPRPDQVKMAVDSLRKGRLGWRESFDAYRILLQSDDRKALEYGRTDMRRHRSSTRRMVLSSIAAVSPEPWHEFAEASLDDRDGRIREQAVRVLEALAVSDSLRPLRVRLRKEEEDGVKGRILRALAATGPTDRSVGKELEKFLKRSRDVDMRVQATLAITPLEDDKLVESMLRVALVDREINVQKAAVSVIGMRRERQLMPLLGEVQGSSNLELEELVQAAKACIAEGASLEPFGDFLDDVGGDVDLEAAARRAMGMRRDGGRRGEGDDDEDGDDKGDGEGGADEGDDEGGRRGGGRRGGGRRGGGGD